MAHTYKNSKVDLTTTDNTVLYTSLPVLSKVTVISQALLASSLETSIDFTILTVAAGDVYKTVSLVVVKSTFEFL